MIAFVKPAVMCHLSLSYQISSVIHLLNPMTLAKHEISGQKYFSSPSSTFTAVLTSENLVPFVVLDIEILDDIEVGLKKRRPPKITTSTSKGTTACGTDVSKVHDAKMHRSSKAKKASCVEVVDNDHVESRKGDEGDDSAIGAIDEVEVPVGQRLKEMKNVKRGEENERHQQQNEWCQEDETGEEEEEEDEADENRSGELGSSTGQKGKDKLYWKEIKEKGGLLADMEVVMSACFALLSFILIMT